MPICDFQTIYLVLYYIIVLCFGWFHYITFVSVGFSFVLMYTTSRGRFILSLDDLEGRCHLGNFKVWKVKVLKPYLVGRYDLLQ